RQGRPLAAAAGREQRARGRNPIRTRAFDRHQLAPRDLPLLLLDARAHALAGRRERQEGDAPVVGRARTLPALLPAHGVAARRERFNLDADLVVRQWDAGAEVYGKVCAERPRWRSKSKLPIKVPPIIGSGGGDSFSRSAFATRSSSRIVMLKFARRRSP